jgi:hypothetical protein
MGNLIKTETPTYGGLSQEEFAQIGEDEVLRLIQVAAASCPAAADMEAVVGILLRNKLSEK